MKRYNTPHRHRVIIKTRLTEEEYAEFSERVTLCKMSQITGNQACNGELNVKNQKGKAQSRRKRLSQEIFVK